MLDGLVQSLYRRVSDCLYLSKGEGTTYRQEEEAKKSLNVRICTAYVVADK